MRVSIHLRIRVAPDNIGRFETFLAEAIPYYQQPGGITIRLLRDQNDPTRFIEVVEYANEQAYAEDQIRVEEDPGMRDLLAEWRQLLAEPPVVEVWRG